MINPAQLTVYSNWSTPKSIHIAVYNPDTDYMKHFYNSDILENSLLYTESLCDEDSLTFVGCIPSRFEVTIHDDTNMLSHIKDWLILVDFQFIDENNNTGYTPLFSGYVDDCILQSTPEFYKITAFDILYKWSQLSISDWYNNQLPDRFTVQELKEAFFSYLSNLYDITFDVAAVQQLVNDSVEIRKFIPDSITALDLLKSICQINGVFGRIKRRPDFLINSWSFEFIALAPNPNTVSIYTTFKDVNVSNYSVLQINKVVVKRASNDQTPGVAELPSITTPNTYIIQNNVLLRYSNATTRNLIAQNLLTQVSNAPAYIPFECNTIGYPNVQCGDGLNLDYSESSPTMNFLILSRTLRNVQAVSDNYTAIGQQYQPEIVSDLGQQVSELTYAVEENNATVEEMHTTVQETQNQIQQTNQHVQDLNTAITQTTTISESLIESLVTNLTKTALKPRITHTPAGWRWDDYVVDEDEQITYTPKFKTTNTNKLRNYINIEDTKIKFLTEVLTVPQNYNEIPESDVEYLKFNNKQVYFTDLSTLNAFTLVNPKLLDSTITDAELEMYKCRKLKVVQNINTPWNMEIYENITSVDSPEFKINKIIGIKFNDNAFVEYNSNTNDLEMGMTDIVTGKKISRGIKPDANDNLMFYKKINNHIYDDWIIAKYTSDSDALADTDLPDENFVVIVD